MQILFSTSHSRTKSRRIVRKGLKKGQTVIAIVALMMLSLILGLNISNNLTKRIRSNVLRNDASKAQAAAEAALENILALTDSVLEGYVAYNNCGSNCTWSITDINGQIISASASLAYAGNTAGIFDTDVKTTEVFQLNLTGFPAGKSVEVCWNTPASIYASYVYENGAATSMETYAYNAVASEYTQNGFTQAAGAHDYSSCFTVPTTNTPKLVRVRPLYLDAKVYFVPAAGTSLPIQGILINVTGTAGSTVKKISALKTSSTLPFLFDFTLYQKSASDPLSNLTL
jgi:hypothetical protein